MKKIKNVFSFIMFMCFFIMPFTSVLANANNYVHDDAKVLSSSTIDKVNSNFSKLEQNTGAQAYIYLVPSLNGQSIEDYTANISKSINTNKYTLFVVAIKDRKNKFVASQGLNNVFSESEINRIASIPNKYFKNNDFNSGILEVGKAVDQDITTKAVKAGKVSVKNDGYSKTVVAKKSHSGIGGFIIFILICVIIIFIYKKRKSNKHIHSFAQKNNLHYNDSDNSFRSAGMRNDRQDEYEGDFRRSPNGSNNTTIINNNDGSRGHMGSFIGGMMVGEMLSHNHEHRRDDYYNDNSYSNNNYNDDSSDDSNDKYTSGDWSSSSGDSSWGDSSSSSGDSSWGDSGSSDRDSNSDSGSSDW